MNSLPLFANADTGFYLLPWHYSENIWCCGIWQLTTWDWCYSVAKEAKCTPVCGPLWRHRWYFAALWCADNYTAISLVVKFKLLININDWSAHVQIIHLRNPTRAIDIAMLCVDKFPYPRQQTGGNKHCSYTYYKGRIILCLAVQMLVQTLLHWMKALRLH